MADMDLAEKLTSTMKAWTASRPKPAADVRPTCSECDGTGWTWDKDRTGAEAVRRCATCLTRARGQAPGIPQDEHGRRLATFERTTHNASAIDQATQFLTGGQPDLYLQGGIGTGKTCLACALLNERWAAGESVEFFRSQLFLLSLQPGSENIDWLIRRVAAIPLICLDDLGASQATDFARRMLLVIYEARMDLGHRTIWTSNLDLEDLPSFSGDDRLASRIGGRSLVLTLAGKDWRLTRKRRGRWPAT